MLEHVHMRAAAVSLTNPRAMPVLASVFVPVAALCVAVVGSAWPNEIPSGSSAATATVAGVTVAFAGLLAAAIGLVVMDWLADVRSRAAWTAVSVGALGVSLVVEREQADHVYAPAAPNEAVQAVLRAHRYAVPRLAVEPVDETEHQRDQNRAEPAQLCCAPQTQAAGPVGHPVAWHPGGAEIIGGGAEHGQNGRSADAERTRRAWTVVHSLVPVVSTTRRKREFHYGSRVVKQLRRIDNARAGEAWQGSGSSLWVAGIPIEIVSDIVVLGQHQNGSDGGKPSPDAQFNGGPSIRAGPSTSIAGSKTRSRTRYHPNQIGSFDPTALVEAQRQVLAQPETLARQAANEDDAAEQLEERSRSPPDIVMSRRPELTSVASLPPLDPAVVHFVESLAVADFWRDHAAVQAQDNGRGPPNDTGGNLRTLLDRSSERAID